MKIHTISVAPGTVIEFDGLIHCPRTIEIVAEEEQERKLPWYRRLQKMIFINCESTVPHESMGHTIVAEANASNVNVYHPPKIVQVTGGEHQMARVYEYYCTVYGKDAPIYLRYRSIGKSFELHILNC